MTEPTLPIKSIDETAALEDRLSDNVQENIGPARYFQSEDGEAYEDWHDVFERVATNVAIAEAVYADEDVTVGPNDLADWADPDDVFEAPVDVSLTEDNSSYFDYESVHERAPDDVAERMEETADSFETAMRELRWMPNTPTLINAGTQLQQLSACFVVTPGDSMTEPTDDYTSIMGAASDAADIFQSGGGVGYPFHLLRPKGARIESTDGVSSGPLSFMQIYDTVCGTIAQGGVRRGAQMGIMHCEHPDIGRFCVAKRGEENLTNFNISVGITDDFRDAVQDDEEYTLVDPETGWPNPEPFEVVPETVHFYDPAYEDAWNEQMDKPAEGIDGKVVQENFWRDYLDEMQDPEAFEKYRHQIDLEVGEEMSLPAGFIWQLLIDGAHNKGEPGFYYFDETNRQHSFDVEEHPDQMCHSTNPCAEQPLINYEPCNLGHVNLSLMADEDAQPYHQWATDNLADFEDYHERNQQVAEYLDYALDEELLQETVETGARFLDSVVTMSKFPLEEIEEVAQGQRKVGLGIMGFHQLLLQLGIEYGSQVSINAAREIMRRIDEHATNASHNLAEERGVFPRWEQSKWAQPEDYPEWVEQHGHVDPEEWADGYPVRNHNMTTVAPTGTTSMIGDTTGGCEPLYNVAYFKNVSDDVQGEGMLVEVDDYFQDVLEANDIDVDAVLDELEDLMMANEFDSVDDLETVPDEIGELFVTTEDLSVEDHIRIQGAMQEYVDSGLSKTLNMANDTTVEEAGEAVQLALKLGIKGATIYRVGSRQEEVKTTNTSGGGTTISEATNDTLVDELLDRGDENILSQLDSETRSELMGALSMAQSSVDAQPEPALNGGDD